MLQILSHFPLFTIFIIFIVWSSYEMHKSTRNDRKNQDDFWNREQTSNNVRRKRIDDSEYITIPDSILNINSSNEDVVKHLASLRELKNKKILNLTGKTSTDIKELYGPANLKYVTECDDNFTSMCQVLSSLGTLLKEEGDLAQAAKVLEFAVNSKSDISSTYLALADIYISTGKSEKIKDLISTASSLDSLMKDSIVKNLTNLTS